MKEITKHEQQKLDKKQEREEKQREKEFAALKRAVLLLQKDAKKKDKTIVRMKADIRSLEMQMQRVLIKLRKGD